jgi:hypothetical protein
MSIAVLFDQLRTWARPLMSAPSLTLICGVVGFTFWNRRKTNFEIEKLRLEIENLRRQKSLIQRPTLDEIEKILRETRRFASTRVGFTGQPALWQFVGDLNHYFTVLLAYCGDAQASADISKAQLYAVIGNLPNPYPEYNSSHQSWNIENLDAGQIYERWRSLRKIGYGGLSEETSERLEVILRLLAKGGHEIAEENR